MENKKLFEMLEGWIGATQNEVRGVGAKVDQTKDSVTNLEKSVGILAQKYENCQTNRIVCTGSISDHEKRLRKLESNFYKGIGAAIGISAFISAASFFMKL